MNISKKIILCICFGFGLLLLCLESCKKSDQVICLTCNAPVVIYNLTQSGDTINYVYSLISDVEWGTIQGLVAKGYVLKTDTTWNNLIRYNMCYGQYDYYDGVYPADHVFIDSFCIKQ